MGNKIKFECKCLYVDVNVTVKFELQQLQIQHDN